MLESLFRLLFNYRPVIFQQGEFRLVPSAGSYVAAAMVVVAIAATFLTYRAAKSKSATRASRRPGGDADGDPRAGAVLSVPAGPGRQGGGAAAELPRRADRRLPQHADCGLERGAAREFRAPGVRDAGVAGAQGARPSGSSSAPSGSRPSASRVGAAVGSDVCRRADAHRHVARRRAPGARRAAAGRPGGRERRRGHHRCVAHRCAAGDEGGGGAGIHGGRRARVACQGRAGRPRVGAAHGAQGHLADDRRRRDADRVRRRGGDARRRGRRQASSGRRR